MDDWDNGNEDPSIYGSSAQFNEGDLDGFQIENSGSMMDRSDEADAWLASMEEEDKESPDEGYMKATAPDLQLGRISHLEPRVQAGIKSVLSGGRLEGVDTLDLRAAKDAFASATGESPSYMASRIVAQEVSPVTEYSPEGIAIRTFTPEPVTSRSDKNMILSVLGNVEGYELRGPGSRLAGNELDPDKAIKRDEDLLKAVSYIDELSELYIHDSTKGTSIYGNRKEAVKTAITKRLMDGVFSPESSSIIAAPNELDIAGLKPTKSFRRNADNAGTTAYGRLGFEQRAAEQGWGTDSSEYWENKPDVKGSLFSVGVKKDDPDYARAKRTQEHDFESAKFKAHFARDILRQQMPTNRDESKGQIRMVGWDTPYEEQAARMNSINEATILGVDGSKEPGSDSFTDMDMFLEEEAEPSAPKNNIEGIEQLTPEWHKVRKGLVTASKLTNSSGRVLTSEEIATTLARERLGAAKPFEGNAYTRDGQLGEKFALQAFLNQQKKLGRELVHTEVGLLTNPDLPGMGASPDGRLHTKDGKSAGLLELKYLTTGAMKGALSKYTAQMQLQMAVTGEEQTHFFALDKYTGESIHETVKADPKYQAGMIENINRAIQLEAGLDAKGVRYLEKQTATQRRSGKVPISKAAGQSESYSPKKEVEEEEMTMYDPGAKNVHGIYRKDKAPDASDTAFGRRMEADDQRDRWKSIDRGFDSVQDMETFDEAAESAKELSKSFKELKGSVIGAVAGLAGIANRANDSGMDTVRAASEAGMSADQARGIEFSLVKNGGLTLQGARSSIAAAGQVQRQFNDVTKIASKYTDMTTQWQGAKLDDVAGSLPSINSLRDMSSQAYLEMAQGKINSANSPEMRAQIANALGVPQMSSSRASAEQVGMAGELNEAGARAFYKGLKGIEQTAQTVSEQAIGATGETGGQATGVANVALQNQGIISGIKDIVTNPAVIAGGSATAGYLATKAKSIRGAVTGPAAKGIATTAGKAVATGARLSPLAIAATAVPMAARHVGDIKDDGGLGDSAMDVLEFASYGAGLGGTLGLFGGPLAPLSVPAGAALGAIAGTGVGLANEAWEYLTGDDEVVPSSVVSAIPSTNIDSPTGQHISVAAPNVSNNIDVNVMVDPNMVKTDTSVNGEDYSDTETNYGS